MLTPKQLVTTQIIVFYSFQKSENKVFKYRNCPTDFSCWLNWSTEIENVFHQNPKKGACRYPVGGSQGGKEPALQQHCCTTTTTTKVPTSFPGISPTRACGAREG